MDCQCLLPSLCCVWIAVQRHPAFHSEGTSAFILVRARICRQAKPIAAAKAAKRKEWKLSRQDLLGRLDCLGHLGLLQVDLVAQGQPAMARGLKSRNGMQWPCGHGPFAQTPAQYAGITCMSQASSTRRIPQGIQTTRD